jgi:GT2 family glycosyltransferase
VTLPTCDVVIATRNRREALGRCLRGLRDQTHRAFRVVIVDDASDVDLRPVVEDPRFADLDITLIRREQQAGPAAARNAGVEAATAEYIIFLDDDVLPDRHFVQVHLEAVSRPHPPDAPIVSMGPFVQPADWEPTPWNLWEAKQAKKEADAMLRGDYEPTWRQFHTGNNCLPTAAFRAVGGFDETFKRAEDDELAIRLRDLGCVFVFEPSAIAWHYSNRSRDAWLAIPKAYAHFDVMIDRLHPHARFLPLKKWGLSVRRKPLRAVRRVFSGRRTNLGVTLSVRTGEALYKAGLVDGAMGALSMAYDLSYVESLRQAEASMPEPVGG